MITVRKSHQRGHVNHGWLDSYHTFSFGSYYDPAHMGISVLRVINEDRVAPGGGFPTHGHQDMEIISYVLGGALQHKDSLGNTSVIRPGDVQRMSAGTGVMHSEFNASDQEPVHFLQIWIRPNTEGVTPSYEQTFYGDEEKRGRLRLVASPDGAAGSVTIHQDARLYSALVDGDEVVTHSAQPERRYYAHIARGAATINGESLEAGDGIALSDESAIRISGGREAEVLLFELPSAAR